MTRSWKPFGAAVRFVRSRAGDYHVDADRLGIYGHSSGGHLALMQAFAPEEGDKTAVDPVDRLTSRVAMAAALSAPTDFLNWGTDGVVNLGDRTKPGLFAPFQLPNIVRETVAFGVERAEKKGEETCRSISPVSRATKGAAPVLLIHGAKDATVPPQQSQRLVARLRELGANYLYIEKSDTDHSWKGIDKEMGAVAEWFTRQAAR